MQTKNQYKTHNEFQNDVLSAEFEVTGNILIFSFKTAFLCQKWRMQKICIRGVKTRLKGYDFNLMENTTKGFNARLYHDLNYSITLLKVEASITLPQLKNVFC